MPRDFSQESLVTPFDRRIDFLENELCKKDEMIKSLKILNEMGQKELNQIKMELSVAKSYINSLPTLEEVGKLKNALSDLNDEKQQLTCDLYTLKELNSELTSKISALHKKGIENKSELQNKTAEADALKYTIKLWENRRRAAQQAGHVTVEDIMADKMKLEEQFQDMLKIAACREQFFKARIDKMKDKVEKHKYTVDTQLEICSSLRAKTERFKAELEEIRLENNKLNETKKDLEKNFAALAVELGELKAVEVIWKKTDSDVRQCIVDISKCQKAARRLIVFINNAISKQFLDPALLFSSCDDDLEYEDEDNENLEKSAQIRLNEIEILNKHIKECQKMITEIYVSKLSTLGDSQCQIQ
ncbi:filament-like plant protein 2 [Daphnia magna]|uniref:Uncharacterized protein n=2 Tax=Daphnia magna TaxID=35525 RepID=A0A162Q074_9CRUS|nr:filament-like plant protein 2 [Daphnia magna]KZS19287.1 Uncharacterized protein APZ42_014128 [Daphnia magna]